MSSLWNSSAAESGILRKNDTKDKLDDLLVFGYACKLFRDDHRALEIDQGKHLIPWMGENTLKIDRYDGRGALSDLKPFEASKEGYDATRWLGLSESERKIEQLCDEERYYALHTNEEEDELYKEEELKRLQSNQIHYNYDEKSTKEEQKTETTPTEEDDEPFVAAPGLDVPLNMILPKTVKQNARIEKTASFISKQGPQMEILLKTKQSGNPQFSFLNQDDPLYRYYRHILMAIKTGRYQIPDEQVKNEENEKRGEEEDHYLHPSLARIGLQQPVHSAPIIPQINYKPSANCAYSQLINKIKGNHLPPPSNQQPLNQNQIDKPPLPPPPAAAPDQYYQLQFYQQYGYWPQVDQIQQQGAPPPPLPTSNKEVVVVANPYAQIVSNVSKTKPEDVNEPQKDETTKSTESIPETTHQQPSLFSLAQYSGTESEEDDEEQDAQAQAVVIPPADVQIIIDKMASYVAKNGIDFETIVKAKGDVRFIFLEAKHLYNPYYKTKLKEYQEKDSVKPVKSEEEPEIKKTKSKEKKIITPVSFSIKKHSFETQQVPRDKSALPVEDSTDDESIQNNNQEQSIDNEPTEATVETTDQQTEEPKQPTVIEIEDPIMELIDLTEDLEEKRDRRAEDRVKDKLALAAREKLAAKNRALQLERKKRAAAFLSQLKPQSSSNSNKQENEEQVPHEDSTINEEYSRLIYHIDSEKFTNNESIGRSVEKRPRSRSRSRNTHKSSRHQRKSHKRSHSHSRKRKREKRSHERKKSKRRHRSRSRSTSTSKHRKPEKKDILIDCENKNRQKTTTTTEQLSVSSSDYESDDYPTNVTNNK